MSLAYCQYIVVSCVLSILGLPASLHLVTPLTGKGRWCCDFVRAVFRQNLCKLAHHFSRIPIGWRKPHHVLTAHTHTSFLRYHRDLGCDSGECTSIGFHWLIGNSDNIIITESEGAFQSNPWALPCKFYFYQSSLEPML
jgi:hypothetical protein